MEGLLDAVASRAFADYIETKTRGEHESDPIEEMRRGWDVHVGFGLDNPEFYKLMYGQPGPLRDQAASKEAAAILDSLVERAAAAGLLSVGVQRAVQMILSAGIGTTLTLISTSREDRDPELSLRTREAILAAVTTVSPEGPTTSGRNPATHAVALKALLPGFADVFSPGEQVLLGEWLDRVTNTTTHRKDEKP
jgi:hypothetical protein